jgi:hypothetical protein
MTPRAKVQKLEYVLDSPASATFKDRKDSGKILATQGGDIQPTMSDEIEIENLIDTKSFKLLSFDRRHIADEIAYFINERCELIENRLGIVEQASYSMITDVPITVCGMIICEGSKGDEGVYLLRDGEQVQLDISELEGSSIFPGMICAVEGVNLTGKLIVVSKIHQLTDQATEDEGVKEDTTIVVCCGPYFTSDNTSNEPLEELITQVASLAPHLAIFMGPFLDQSHMGADCISVENLNELWKKQIESLAQSGTKVRMIPSTADLFADPVIPTRAIDEQEFAYCREHMVSNPCFLAANKWNIAAISVDLPLSLMKTEIVKSPSNSCKFSRIGEHILSQQCMMPLFPAPEEISVDYSKFKENICFEKQPNVLFVRSELNPFIRLVGNTIFINPGKLTKGKGGGSYATIQLNSSGHRAKIQKL